jgi:sialic acid synthase SpsE
MADDFLKPLKKNTICQTFVIADAGVHHGCSLQMAKDLIGAASQAGADAIKFQTYKAERLVTHWAPTYWQASGEKATTSQFDYFRQRDKFEFEDYAALSTYCQEKKIVFVSTAFDTQSVKWLNALDVPFWKVASADIDNFPLLEEIAQTKKPIILSTGASYFNEIIETVNFLHSKDVEHLALLHCNLAYPTPDNQANLLRIVELKKRFPKITIGYSDHTIPDDETTIPITAVALGAKIIEKHFTLNRNLPEDDHYHSVDPVLLRRMIRRIKLVEDAIAGFTEINDSEMPARKNARRSLVAKQTIIRGSVLTPDIVIPKRPAGGIPPSLIHKVVGRKVKVTLQQDQQLQWDVLE